MTNNYDSLEFFSDARIALMKEVRDYWPELSRKLVEQRGEDPTVEWPDQLGVIAAECKVLLDGFYTPGQMEDLTDKLIWALRAKRSPIAVQPVIGLPLSEYGKDIPSQSKIIKSTKH